MSEDSRRFVHPFASVLADAAAGRFPPADGDTTVLPADVDETRAVVAFTGHAFVLGPVDIEVVRGGGYGAVHDPTVLTAIGGGDGEFGSLDVVLATRPAIRAVSAGVRRIDAGDERMHHPRVMRALAHRRNVRVYGNDHGVVILGQGLVGRTELSVELTRADSPAGAGRALITAGLALSDSPDWCWAQVAAGNARSLRAFLAAGFTPVCSEVLITPSSPSVGSSPWS